MKNRNSIIAGIVGFAALIILVSAAFVVDETQQVVITQFGRPVGEAITEPGIYFKLPLIQETHFFDKRFLEWDGDSNQVPTKDKRFIWVDTYGRWRISDPLLFFQRLRDERGAHSRLDDILDGETRNAVANHDLVEIVRNTNREPMVVLDTFGKSEELDDVFPNIKVGREKITREILAAATEKTKELGIELLDLRLKRIEYVEEVRRKVYDRMITERKRIADKYRSEGQGEASKIIGDKERELKRIQSEAYKTAEEIKGKADAEATAIFARAYNQNADSRDFYRFTKTLETYKETFSEKDWLLLSTKSDFYKYLEKESGR
ncbi:MAG: protease modulator HflC [Calditrichaceae bacterium]